MPYANIEDKRAWGRRYAKTPNGKAIFKRYRSTEKGKLPNARYSKSEHGRAVINAAERKRSRSHKLKQRFGITIPQWEAMFEAQGKACAICKSNSPGRVSGLWSTDHNHITKEVRGILCFQCNIMLGMGRDDPSRLREGAKYLEIGGRACQPSK